MSIRQIMIGLAGLLILLTCVGFAACESQETPRGNLYFVQAGPSEEVSPRGPHSVFVYRLDEEKGSLTEVARTPNGDWVNGVKCYSEMNRLAVSTNKTNYDKRVEKIFLFGAESPEEWDLLDVQEYGIGYGFRLVETSPEGDVLQVSYEDSAHGRKTVYLNSKTREPSDGRSLNNVGEYRLAGLKSFYYGPSQDVVSLKIDRNGQILSYYHGDIELGASSVPDSIVTMKESVGWTLIASEIDYLAMCSVPHTNGLTQRELLVFNRSSNEWISLLVDGNETRVRPINKWLIGEVAQSHPNTDWVRRSSVPPVLSGEFVFVNPTTLESYKVHAGEEAEFLWIDDNQEVYYRVGRELYRAKLEDGGFVDRELILKDWIVRMIHWAFRGPGAQ